MRISPTEATTTFFFDGDHVKLTYWGWKTTATASEHNGSNDILNGLGCQRIWLQRYFGLGSRQIWLYWYLNSLGKPQMTSKVDGFGYNDILNGGNATASEDNGLGIFWNSNVAVAKPMASEDNGSNDIFNGLGCQRIWLRYFEWPRKSTDLITSESKYNTFQTHYNFTRFSTCTRISRFGKFQGGFFRWIFLRK